MGRRIAFLAVIALILIVAGVAGAKTFLASPESDKGQWEVIPVTRGEIDHTVKANGRLHSNQSILLTWRTAGKVAQVNVRVGDRVTTGQELASLDPTSLPQPIILAQVDLADAQTALQDLYDSPKNLDLAQAEQNEAQAKQTLEKAQEALDNLTTPASQEDIDHAYATMILAQHHMKELQDKIAIVLQKANKNPNSYAFWESRSLYQSILQSLQLEEIAARKAYYASVHKYNQVKGTPDPADLAVAQANLAVATANLRDAADEVDRLKAGPSADDLAQAEARVEAAQAIVDQSRIEAAIDGTVTEVTSSAGDWVSEGMPALRLDDTSALLAVLQVSEIDINPIRLGQKATLTFDAAPGGVYHGQVSEISPVGIDEQGIAEFKVTVKVDNPDEKIKLGMSVEANIITDQVKDALLIPNQALRRLDGDQVVYVLEADGTLKPVKVELGITSEAFSQLKSGNLQAGDRIVTNPPASTK